MRSRAIRTSKPVDPTRTKATHASEVIHVLVLGLPSPPRARVAAGANRSTADTSTAPRRSRSALIAPSAHNDLAFTQSMYDALLKPADEVQLQALRLGQPVRRRERRRTSCSSTPKRATTWSSRTGRSTAARSSSSLRSSRRSRSPGAPRRRRSACRTCSRTRRPRTRAATCRASWPRCMSKTQCSGVIGPIAVGDAKLYVDGFEAGAQAANPKTATRSATPARSATRASCRSRRRSSSPRRPTC